MFTAFFGDILRGRLEPMRFLGLLIALGILIGVLGAILVFVVGIAGEVSDGSLKLARDMLRQSLGLPGIVAIGAVVLALGFAKLNLVAKRVRDMGLPGWAVAVPMAVISLAAQSFAGLTVAAGIGVAMLLFLLIVPRGTFTRD